MKRIVLGVSAAFVVLLAVLVARTLSVTPAVEPQPEPLPAFEVDTPALAQKLSALIRCRTISTPSMREDAQFDALYQQLHDAFPKVHEAAKVERPGRALLFTLEGSDPSLPALVLMAHHDVVPVEPGTEALWSHAPWSGDIADGFVWGRGAMDDKSGLVTVLQALEDALTQGWRPRRTVLVASGHDEESGGSGAQAIADLLKTRGVKPYLVMDEGLSVTDGVVSGIKPRVAMIGIAEKGFLTLELAAKGQGGHSSMPPPQTATGIVAAAITKLEASPFPTRLDTPTGQMLDALAPHLAFSKRLAVANRWLLAGPLMASLAGKPAGAATLRTTTAATMFQGSVKDNVLAARASARVNFRILPGDTREAVTARVKQIIGDERVEVTLPNDVLSSEPSPVSRTDGPAFAALRSAIRRTYPDAVIAPGLVVGATDARSFAGLSDQVYRFVPAVLTPEDLVRFHGTNERVSVDGLAQGVRFYRLLLSEP